jgi:ATP-dependent DNA ligase
VARKGNDWTSRYPFVVEAVNHPKVRSCVIDGEVVCCDERGVTAFHLLPIGGTSLRLSSMPSISWN